MHILKSMIIAFSIYSKIPVPQFEWKEEDMKYMLCFFPWIGAVVGGCICLWKELGEYLGVQPLCYTLIGTAIPLLITGGFHMDGFMDTMDAFHSYQPKEKKLEILKDPHIGAFSVIMLALYGLIYVAAFSEITDITFLKIVAAGFFMARCLSGISVVCFSSAKKDGMLSYFADNAHKQKVKWILIIQTVLCVVFMLRESVLCGALACGTAMLVFTYYYWKTKNELSGITGDTAGYFVVLCEGSMMVTVALMNCLG